MQVIGNEPVPGSFSESFNRGLQQLVQMKLGKLQQRSQMSDVGKAFQSLGLPEQQANAFATLPPHVQVEAIRSGLFSSLVAPATAGSSPQMDAAQEAMVPSSAQAAPQMQQVLQQPPTMAPQQILQRALSGGMTPDQQQQIAAPTQAPIAQPRARVMSPTAQPMTTKERAEQFKQQKEAVKLARVEQKAIDTQVKPYVDTLDKKGGAAAEVSDLVLDRMSKLIDSGNLTGATMYNFRKKMEHSGHLIGGGIGTAIGALVGSAVPVVGTMGGAAVGGGIGTAAGEAIMPKFVGSKEDQEFTKLSLNFMEKLKDIFGGRVAIQEMQMYMDSIPTLAMTDEGKKQVIKDMKLISSGWRHKKQIKDKIVRANSGHYPSDLEQQVEEASKPFMDRMTKEFLS